MAISISLCSDKLILVSRNYIVVVYLTSYTIQRNYLSQKTIRKHGVVFQIPFVTICYVCIHIHVCVFFCLSVCTRVLLILIREE